jgi:hypothetical protein
VIMPPKTMITNAGIQPRSGKRSEQLGDIPVALISDIFQFLFSLLENVTFSTGYAVLVSNRIPCMFMYCMHE